MTFTRPLEVLDSLRGLNDLLEQVVLIITAHHAVFDRSFLEAA